MRAALAPLLAISATGVLCACAGPDAPAAEVAAPDSTATAPAQAPSPDPETVSARYECPGAGMVDIIREGRFARLRMTDGRIVHLGVIRGSEPPVWSEVGLRFSTAGGSAELSEEDGRSVQCHDEPLQEAAA